MANYSTYNVKKSNSNPSWLKTFNVVTPKNAPMIDRNLNTLVIPKANSNSTTPSLKSSSSSNSSKYKVQGGYSTYNIPKSSSSNQAQEEFDWNSLLSGGGGGGYGVNRIDLSDILATYDQSAASQKKTLSDSAESQRQALLTSLKRFQEDTATARKQQQAAYNASRADLEAQAFMANRQAAQSAAARGIGGSGLQQLAQLQNIIGQSESTNQLAQSNTETLNELARALAQREEDVTKSTTDITRETANKLAEIDATTANLKEQLQYQEAVRYENAREQAAAAASAASASNASLINQYKLAAAEEAKSLKALETNTNRSLQSALNKGIQAMKTAASGKGKVAKQNVQAAYDAAYGQMQDILSSAATTGLAYDYTTNFENQLLSAFNKYYK